VFVCLEFGAADGRNEVQFVMTWSKPTAPCPHSWTGDGNVRVILHT